MSSLAEEKSDTERMKIKVVYGVRTSERDENRPLYYNQTKHMSNPGERRNMQNNFTVLYQYEGSSDYKYDGSCDYDYFDGSSNYQYDGSNYSYNDSYKYSSPVYSGENFRHCGPQPIQHNDSQLYNKNTCPRPSLLRTPPTLRGISPNNIVCSAPPPQTPVTTAPPSIPNVMFPPPANQV